MLISTIPDDLCLAYANTRFWRGSPEPTEKLQGFSDLLAWLERDAGLGSAALHDVKTLSREHPRKVSSIFDDALAIREAIFRSFEGLASGSPLRDADFALLKQAIAEAPARRLLARADGRYGWTIEALRPSAAQLLTPVLWAAADLLTNAERRRIRQCANDKCLWLFLDESKSGTRRWCDMTSCGNRAKAQRHYARIKQA